MKNYIYLVVIVGPDHNSKTAVIAGEKELKGLSLSRVLAMGWTPVRETPMQGGEFACSLVILEKDDDGQPVQAAVVRESKPEPKPEPKPERIEVKPKPAPVPVPEKVKAVEVKGKPVQAAKVVEVPAKSKPEPKPSDSDISFDFLADGPQ